jgi:predicted amidophosphoribosyltransferase
MQPLEVALFVVVVALALGLLGTVVWPYVRSRRTIPETGAPASLPGAPIVARTGSMVCPACQRDFEPGLQYCPHDARELVAADDPAARLPGQGMTCPSCKRSFPEGRRFCAFDGEELVPLVVALGGADLPSLVFAGAHGRICPSCSRRYENDATFCGRDGAELVAVN